MYTFFVKMHLLHCIGMDRLQGFRGSQTKGGVTLAIRPVWYYRTAPPQMSPPGGSVPVQILRGRNLVRYRAYYRFAPVITDSLPHDRVNSCQHAQ